MDKKMLSSLLGKPDLYLEIWVFLFASSDSDNVWRGNLSDIQSRYRVPKTTLQRITSFDEWGEGKVERNWDGKDLVIRFLSYSNGSETVLVPPPTKRGGRKLSDKDLELRNDCLDIYRDFYCEAVGINPNIDGMQMKALDKIIKYLKSNVKDNGTDQAVKDAWQFIFDHWDYISPFYQENIKLNQIHSNINNIIFQIKKAIGTEGKANRASAKKNKMNTARNLSTGLDTLIREQKGNI